MRYRLRLLGEAKVKGVGYSEMPPFLPHGSAPDYWTLMKLCSPEPFRAMRDPFRLCREKVCC
jgi:hypothetical protein